MWNVAETQYEYIAAEQAREQFAAGIEREARAVRRWRPRRRAPDVQRGRPIIATP